jgi:hypothetical protein
MRQFVNVAKQQGVDLSELTNKYICSPTQNTPIRNHQPVVSQPSATGRVATLQIWLNNVLGANVTVNELSDGSWAFYDQNISFIGRTTLSVNFNTCSATIQNAILSGTYGGQKIGYNECQFQVSGYAVKLKLIFDGQSGNGGSIIPGLTNEQLLLYGGIALLAIVGLVLITRR